MAACDAIATDDDRIGQAHAGLSMVERLVDQSLLSVRPGPDGEARFGMLETIREFARGKLSEVNEQVLRDRHLAFFLALAEDTDRASRGPEQIRRLRELVADQANVRAALAWAHETGDEESLTRLAAALEDRFWYDAGGIREGLAWLDTALLVAPLSSPTVRARLFERAGVIARELGLRERSLAMFEASLTAATDGLDELGMAEAMHRLVRVALDDEGVDFDLVAARLDEATALALRAGAIRPMVDIRVTQGEIARRRGDLALARACFEDAIRASREAEDASAMAYALLQLGFLDRFVGDFGAALESLAASRELCHETGDKALLAWSTLGMARTLVQLGDLAAARLQLRDGVLVVDDLRECPGTHPGLDRSFALACRCRTDAGRSRGLGCHGARPTAHVAAPRARVTRTGVCAGKESTGPGPIPPALGDRRSEGSGKRRSISP